ncbi:hypothetical protein ABZ471_45015 [Streptomyces sp. NPDC005728]|uniref:hypothetical protein n=1 Tax=Streptomyces sp. NPDC005728 TaxID=3157054 RepID=UPI0033D52938
MVVRERFPEPARTGFSDEEILVDGEGGVLVDRGRGHHGCAAEERPGTPDIASTAQGRDGAWVLDTYPLGATRCRWSADRVGHAENLPEENNRKPVINVVITITVNAMNPDLDLLAKWH